MCSLAKTREDGIETLIMPSRVVVRVAHPGGPVRHRISDAPKAISVMQSGVCRSRSKAAFWTIAWAPNQAMRLGRGPQESTPCGCALLGPTSQPHCLIRDPSHGPKGGPGTTAADGRLHNGDCFRGVRKTVRTLVRRTISNAIWNFGIQCVSATWAIIAARLTWSQISCTNDSQNHKTQISICKS